MSLLIARLTSIIFTACVHLLFSLCFWNLRSISWLENVCMTYSCLSSRLSPHPPPGMFANAEGVSQRAPVNWSESVIGAAVCFPYVVALDESFITIHSMLDQQLKQTLSFRDGHIMQDFEGTLKRCFNLEHSISHLIKLPIYQNKSEGVIIYFSSSPTFSH